MGCKGIKSIWNSQNELKDVPGVEMTNYFDLMEILKCLEKGLE